VHSNRGGQSSFTVLSARNTINYCIIYLLIIIIAISFHALQNKSNLKPEIVFQDMDIKYKNETKFFGIYVTEDIKWDVHIKHVCSILNKNYYVTQLLKTVTTINTLRSIYFANFHSHLRYGILFWGGNSQSTKSF
jgi:hypothetical protein